MNREDLEKTIENLKKLADWFEKFGNYTRARDCHRMVDGLQGYAEDIISD